MGMRLKKKIQGGANVCDYCYYQDYEEPTYSWEKKINGLPTPVPYYH